ncbi:MAG: hypothetical protein ABFD10_04050 [Prolixibacteraceae bacterium]
MNIQSVRNLLFRAARYDDLATMKRDLTGMRPYSRMAPTYFTYEVFDHINDSRFWKVFRTKHRVNKGGSFKGKGLQQRSPGQYQGSSRSAANSPNIP